MRSEYELRFKGRGYDRLDDKQQEQKNKDSEQEIIRILDNRADYLALVPVLFTKQRPRMREKEERKSNRKMVYPQYLTALKRRKGDTPEELIGKMVGARAYFIYRGEVYRPLCLLCPHSIDSVVGDCKFGTKGCYFNLGRIGESDFTRGGKAYRKLAEEIDEPELNLKEDS